MKHTVSVGRDDNTSIEGHGASAVQYLQKTSHNRQQTKCHLTKTHRALGLQASLVGSTDYAVLVTTVHLLGRRRKSAVSVKKEQEDCVSR